MDPARALSGGESGAAGGALSADRASLPATSGLWVPEQPRRVAVSLGDGRPRCV